MTGAGQGHDLIGAEPRADTPPQALKPALGPPAANLEQDDAPVGLELKIHDVAGAEVQAIADRFGDRDLTLAGDSGCHDILGNTFY